MDHPLAPISNSHSSILILGSFPSVMSRKTGFYYANPQNRFWRILCTLFQEEVPPTTQAKTEFLLNHDLALWDVVHSCDILGSSDASIQNVIPNDIDTLIKTSSISKIYANGNLAYNLYMKFCFLQTGIPIVKLPSTSSANANVSVERLLKAWELILQDDLK